MRLIPVGEHLIVRPLEDEWESCIRIALPESVQPDVLLGKVLAVGEGALLQSGRRAPLEVHEGDRILFAPQAGQEVRLNGEKLRILRQQDVLAVV